VNIFEYWFSHHELDLDLFFYKLGISHLTSAVSFRLGLIFQTVLPICPSSPTPQIAYCSPIYLRLVFHLTASSLLSAAFCKATCYQSSECIRPLFQIITHLSFHPAMAKYVFRLFLLLRISRQFTSCQSTQITGQ